MRRQRTMIRGVPIMTEEQRKQKRKQEFRLYYAENSVAISSRRKTARKLRRDKITEYDRLYRASHPEIVSKIRNKRRAIKQNSSIGDLSQIAAWEKTWRSQKKVTCHWCGTRREPREFHVDHVIPISKGGSHILENLCVSCAGCNHQKNCMMPEMWNKKLSQPLLII